MHKKLQVLLTVAAIAVMVVMFAGLAQASPITLANNSFESDVVADGASTSAITGWHKVSGTTQLQVYNPTSADFASANGNGILPSPAAGSQCLFDADTTTNSYIIESAATTSWVLTTGATYTVTVAVGQGLQGSFHNLSMGYFDATNAKGNFQALTVSANQAPTAGTFKDFSYTFAASSLIGGKVNGHVGDQMQVTLSMGGQNYVDNVRIDDGLVPEPSTLALLAAGLIGLLAYAWRKRR